MKLFKKAIASALIAAIVHLASLPGLCAGNVNQSSDVISNMSDAIIYVLPAVAFGMTLGARDRTGTRQFVESAGVTMGITAGLKYAIHSVRPNGEAHSFPSGHVAIMVTSAEFMRGRYGWKYGLPSYIMASFVGYERIRSRKHHLLDVVGGASIAFAGAYLITRRNRGWSNRSTVERGALGATIEPRGPHPLDFAAVSIFSTLKIANPCKGWALQPVVEREFRGVRICRSF